jgi:hypothetical protein
MNEGTNKPLALETIPLSPYGPQWVIMEGGSERYVKKGSGNGHLFP